MFLAARLHLAANDVSTINIIRCVQRRGGDHCPHCSVCESARSLTWRPEAGHHDSSTRWGCLPVADVAMLSAASFIRGGISAKCFIAYYSRQVVQLPTKRPPSPAASLRGKNLPRCNEWVRGSSRLQNGVETSRQTAKVPCCTHALHRVMT